MKIYNNSNHNITLINNKIIKKYEYLSVQNIDEQMDKQLKNLLKKGLIRID